MSDHTLAVWGVVVGVSGIIIGILTAYYFYLKARMRIDPRYLMRYEPLVDKSSRAMADVSVLFKGNEVTNLNRCIVIIYNRGNQPIGRDAIAENDKVQVRFPAGAVALNAGVIWTSRPAIDLSADISDNGAAVTIDFAFLDTDDGGIVEILYQGNPKKAPTLTGSIMGAPKGIQAVQGKLLVNGPQAEEEQKEEIETGVSKSWLMQTAALCILVAISAVSAIILGPVSPLSVVLYTIIAELILVVLFYSYLAIYARRKIGSTNFWKKIPRGTTLGDAP